MLKSVLANIVEKFLQMRNLHHAHSAKGIQSVAGKFTFPHITANPPRRVIGGEARVTHRSGLHAAYHGAECIFLAHGPGNDLLKIHWEVLEKMLRQIAAMETHSLVGIVAVIVIPVEQGAGSLRRQS